MSPAPQTPPSFSPRQRWRIMLHVALTTVLVLAVVVMVNYLSRDYFLRLPWSAQTKTELSPLTVKFLQALTNQVKITLFYDKHDELYGTIANLLNQYRLANSRLTVQTVDFLRDPGLAQKVRAAYDLAPNAKNVIIFDCPGLGRQSIEGNMLTRGAAEIVRGDKELLLRRKPLEFLGERVFTSALIAATNPKPLNAYFLEDHPNEHSIARGDTVGYQTLTNILAQNYIRAQPLSLLDTNTVPADCHLLVVAWVPGRLWPHELEQIDEYLSRGGRLLALFNASSPDKQTGLVPPSGLEALLEKWGVEVGNAIVVDPANSPNGEGLDMVVSGFSLTHPVVNPLLGSGLYLIRPRKVARLKTLSLSADAPRVDEIAYTGTNSFTTLNPRHRQSYPVMVAVENKIRGVTTERGSTRILVVGDSLFLANGWIDDLSGNRLFAAQAANWLLDRMQLLPDISPRPLGQYRVVMTVVQMRTTQWLLLAGLPGAVLVLGGLVWLRRRQ